MLRVLMDTISENTLPLVPNNKKSPDPIEETAKKVLQTPISRRGLLRGLFGGTLAALFPAGVADQSKVEDQTDSPTNEQAISKPETQQIESVARKFETIEELNTYIAEKEKRLGWGDQNSEDERFGEAFKEERSKLRPSNKDRTTGFIVSDKLMADLEKRGEDPIDILTRHIDYLNNLYKEAHVDLHYDLTDISILPDDVLGSYTNIKHNHQEGIVLKDGEVFYPRYQDSTWVLSRDCNDTKIPNYAEKLTTRFADRIDVGLIHELIHHVGIGDFYTSHREFGPRNTVPVSRYLPDYEGFMSMNIGSWEKISAWESFFLQKLIENGTFSPQHDGNAVVNVVNPETKQLEYYLRALASQYSFTLQDRENNNLAPAIDGFYLSTNKVDENDHHFLTGENFERTNDSVILSHPLDKIDQSNKEEKGMPSLFVFKSNSSPGIWLPLDNHLLAIYRLAQTGETCQPFIFINPKLLEMQQSCNIGLDVIKRTEEIPAEFNGNPVYGYSEINDDLRAVWWIKPT